MPFILLMIEGCRGFSAVSLWLLCGERMRGKLLLLGCYCALVGAVVAINGKKPHGETVHRLLARTGAGLGR